MDVKRRSSCLPLFALSSLCLLFVGCSGGSDSSGGPPTTPPVVNLGPSSTVYLLERASSAGVCDGLWLQISAGRDTDGDGQLDAGEVTDTEAACSSESAESMNVHFRTSAQASGGQCQLGGERIEFGPDANGNGQLDQAEIEGDTSLCHRLSDLVAPEADFSIDEDQVLSVPMVPGAAEDVRLQVLTRPSFGELRLQGGRFRYTPEADWSGSDSFSVRVENDAEAIDQEIAVAVAPVNDEPTLGEQSYELYRGSYLKRPLAATDADGDSIAYALEEDVSAGRLELSEDGTFNYRPAQAFASDDSFSVRLNDGSGWTEPFVVQLQVLAPETQPLLDLGARLITYNEVELSWTANYGSATGYEIRTASQELSLHNWQDASVVSTSTELGQDGDGETLRVADLEPDQDQFFGLRLVDAEGPSAELSNIAWVKTASPLSIELVGEPPAAVSVERKQERQQTFEIRNNGPSDVHFTTRLSSTEGQSLARQRPAGHKPLAVAKGAKDPRKGAPVLQNSGGPDAFGYRWVDSRDSTGPTYHWIDIQETGTAIEGISDDVVVGPFPIGFQFPFYGAAVEEFYLSSNGFIAFSDISDSGCCSGQPLPSHDGLSHLIAWLWEDLYPRDGQIFYQTLADGRFVLQFENVEQFGGGGTVTAQVILSRDGSILLQYKSITGWILEGFYSIGIENSEGTDGLQVAFNTPYLENELAVRIAAVPQWLSVSPNANVIPAGESETLTLRYQALADIGTYEAVLHLVEQDAAGETLALPLEMRITADVTPPNRVADLQAQSVSYDRATIAWSAVADSSIAAEESVAAYELRYSTAAINDANWQNATPVSGLPAPARSGELQSVTVAGLESEADYYFAIKVSDDSGNTSALSNVVAVTTPTPPVASLNVNTVAMELVEGEQRVGSLTLRNTGGAPLTFSSTLVERPELAGLHSQAAQTFADGFGNRPVKKLESMPPADSYVAGEIILRIKRGANASVLHAIQQQYGATTIQRIPELHMEVWQLPATADDFQAIQALNAQPEVVFAEPNYRVSLQAIPDDSEFGELWGLHNTGANDGLEDADIDALEAWEITAGSQSVVVAVIDTGIDYEHGDLAANMWINPGEIPDNGLDDDANGFVDDVYGYNFHADHADPQDFNGHGTHVAGTIGALGNNGLGVVGVNHQVSLMAVPFLGADGSGSHADAIEAIIYAVDNGADILNNSWGGGGYSEALLAAIEYAHINDTLFVAAAGNWAEDNDLTPAYPAGFEVANIISVAATDRNDAMASFSNYGRTTVDLGAPGVDTLSTVPGQDYQSFSGTSMATPHVAGAAALLKAHKPGLTHMELKALLLDSVDPLDSLTDRVWTGGRLNAHQALLLSGPSWVALSNNGSGRLASGEELQIALQFDALDLEAGEYVIDLQVQTNDPLQPVITLPVTLTVLPDPEPPAAVDDLALAEITDTTAEVSFTAPGDDGTEGRASAYQVRYATQPLTDANWAQAQTLEGAPVPGESGSLEQFSVTGLAPNSELWLAIRAIDNMGQVSALSNVVELRSLSADLSLSPEPVPSIVLAPGASEIVELVLENLGEVDIRAAIDIGDSIDSFGAYTVQYFATNNLAKGELDTRSGQPVATGRGGPDDFGYRWTDSDEPDGPEYRWEDISATGQRVNGLFDDSVSAPIDIGFTFPFYGEPEHQVYISSNGFVAFSEPTSSGCCAGQPVPQADSINHIIAWLWYDLYPGSGEVHYQTLEDNRFVIQFSGYGEYGGGGTVDAQLVLHRSGMIELRYGAFYNQMATELASIGIENHNGSAGLQVAFNTEYLKNEHAVMFNPHWLSASDSQVTLAPGESATVLLHVDAGALEVGEYQSQVRIQSNDSDQPEQLLPINLEVVE